MDWHRLDNSVVTNTDDITIGGPLTVGQVSNLTLQFSPLLTSHGGQYSCVVSLDVAGGSQTVVVTEQVVVEGESICTIHVRTCMLNPMYTSLVHVHVHVYVLYQEWGACTHKWESMYTPTCSCTYHVRNQNSNTPPWSIRLAGLVQPR